MKVLRTTILLLLLGIVYPIGMSAQTEAETKFMEMADSLGEVIAEHYVAQDYPAVEAACRELVKAYEADSTRLSANYAHYKYLACYNMACMQALQGKREEAIASLIETLGSGRLEITYNKVVNDEELANILDAEELKPVLAKLREESDYLYILQNAPDYAQLASADGLPSITYAPATDTDLMRVRQYFGLDSVAVDGDEVATIKAILTYIHNKIPHDGSHENPTGKANAINYAEACKDGSRGLNCRGLATVLNECYLSMGIPSRVITCLPKKYVSDCHVINAVYSKTLGKWLWIDPTNNAWVTDDRGNLLGIQEVRERLRAGLPVEVNPDANWNNESKTETSFYLYEYMAKNLYILEAWSHYGFGTESDPDSLKNYIHLAPDGCESDHKSARTVTVSNDGYFWQAPGI